MNSRVERGRRILEAEADALHVAAEHLDARFSEVVGAILALRGKVVLTGVGKSGTIAMKVAATLSSTGTPACFLHSVDAVMGDLGFLSKDDLLIAISQSGETSEVVNVVLAAARMEIPAVALTNNPESTLARECRYVLPMNVGSEAGPLGLAPTTSTTVTLALGDALAMVLMEEKRFSREQFAAIHPGGNLGRRLALRVSELMRTGDALPLVRTTDTVARALQEMSAKERLGVTLIEDEKGRLAGILTDGDLRRLLEREPDAINVRRVTVGSVMKKNPRTVEADAPASEALRILEVNSITSLAIVDPEDRPVGIIHIHDILGRGKLIL